jgi:hypothetical protein
MKSRLGYLPTLYLPLFYFRRSWAVQRVPLQKPREVRPELRLALLCQVTLGHDIHVQPT